MRWQPRQRDICRDCGKSHGTNQTSGGHCRGCCESFGTHAAFERHLGSPEEGGCTHPSIIKVKVEGEMVGMVQDKEGDWRIPMSEEKAETARVYFAKLTAAKENNESA